MVINYGTSEISHLSQEDQEILLSRGVNPPMFNTTDISKLTAEGQSWVVSQIFKVGYKEGWKEAWDEAHIEHWDHWTDYPQKPSA